jgi:hypothetical protein
MNKNSTIFFCLFLFARVAGAQPITVISSDIDHFWEAYDRIALTRDTTEKMALFQSLYLQCGSEGLRSLMEARRYTASEYLVAFEKYPQFWASIRANTLKTRDQIPQIEKAIGQLKKWYPALQPVPVYLAIGVLRTNGTAKDNRILIGCEMAATDSGVVFGELPQYLHYYYSNYSNSLKTIDLLCVHEYIHTQQKELVEDLLSASLYEGIAEFISCKVTGIPSNVPALAFGKAHEERVKEKFERDMFRPDAFYEWLWSARKNEFDTRDLGYYIGYSIAERYFDRAKNKKKAIRALIELDYQNPKKMERLVDKSGFFSAKISVLRAKNKKRFLMSDD